jgi:hypothetical protein
MSSLADIVRLKSIERDVKSLQAIVVDLIDHKNRLVERLEALEAKKGPGRPRLLDGYREAASGD